LNILRKDSRRQISTGPKCNTLNLIFFREDSLRLIAEFSKEIKRAVWECESLKSSGTDRINFRGDKRRFP